jgi:transcriptional regulator with XRE-family HTH domain
MGGRMLYFANWALANISGSLCLPAKRVAGNFSNLGRLRMMENKKKPNPIDIHVGSRIRLRRTMLGMSQEKLGESLGITFQQIQKYEKGTNRVGASRLQNISSILNVPVSFFFEDAPGDQPVNAAGMAEASSSNYVVDFLSSSEGLQLNRAFVKISDPKVRRKLVDLVKALAAESDVE